LSSASVSSSKISSGRITATGPGRAGFGEVEGARDGFRGLLRLVHLDHAFGDVGQQFGVVLLLQRLAAEILAFHLADQHHHRRRVMERRMQRDHRIGQSGPAGDDADAGPRAQAAVGDRHEAGAALVPADDHADGIALAQHRGQADITLARHAEHLVDAMRFQAVGQQACDGGGHENFSRLPAVLLSG
jgi:hypothetical protein